jgi:hypothetical protein
MSAERCSREDELLDALGRSFIGPELEEHVTSCSPCSELRMIAGAFLDDRAQAFIEAPVPTASTMWWRLQLRHRQESEAKGRRSLLIGQAATLLVAMSLLVSFLGSDMAFEVKNIIATIRLSTPLLVLLATWTLAAPIAGWVAIRQK